jgi:hypothetical protein
VKNPYRTLGVGLVAAGALFAPVAYFVINSAPLTAMAIVSLLVGFTCIALASTRPYISPEASLVLLQTGMENIAALLEELALRNKAIYVPSSMGDGKPKAIIPLADGATPVLKNRVPGRLVVRYGSRPDEVGIAVTTPGGASLPLLRNSLGPGDSQIESALSYLLVGVLDLATGVTVTSQNGQLNIDIRDPRLHWENIWYYRSLGSPIASMAAAVTCEALGKPVRIKGEAVNNRQARVEIEVID